MNDDLVRAFCKKNALPEQVLSGPVYIRSSMDSSNVPGRRVDASPAANGTVAMQERFHPLPTQAPAATVGGIPEVYTYIEDNSPADDDSYHDDDHSLPAQEQDDAQDDVNDNANDNAQSSFLDQPTADDFTPNVETPVEKVSILDFGNKAHPDATVNV